MNLHPDFLCFLSCFTLLVGGTTTVSGQQVLAENPHKKDISLRVNLLPVGDFPVSGVLIQSERPIIVDPPPSELVPNPIFVKDGKEYKSLGLIMNSPSESWQRPSGSVIDVLTQKDGQYSSYIKVQLPKEKEDVTIFMLRNRKSKDWQREPQAVVFKNGIETFPLGSVRLINFSSFPLVATIGETKNNFAPKSMKILRNPGSKGDKVFFTYQITAHLNGSVLSLVHTAVAYDKKSRMNLVVYDRDGKSEIKLEGDEQPVKVVKYFELPYTAPEAAKSEISPSTVLR